MYSLQNVCLCVLTSPRTTVLLRACRLLEEYLDSKRPLSPVSPLSDDLEPAKPLAKAVTSEMHLSHVHRNKDKNRDSAIKVEKKTHTGVPTLLTFFQLFDPLCLLISRSPRRRTNV